MGIRHPFCNLNISKVVAFTTITRRAQCDLSPPPPPWASGEAPSQGLRPLAVAHGASQLAFLGGLDSSEKSMHSQSLSLSLYIFPTFGAYVCVGVRNQLQFVQYRC